MTFCHECGGWTSEYWLNHLLRLKCVCVFQWQWTKLYINELKWSILLLYIDCQQFEMIPSNKCNFKQLLKMNFNRMMEFSGENCFSGFTRENFSNEFWILGNGVLATLFHFSILQWKLKHGTFEGERNRSHDTTISHVHEELWRLICI